MDGIHFSFSFSLPLPLSFSMHNQRIHIFSVVLLSLCVCVWAKQIVFNIYEVIQFIWAKASSRRYVCVCWLCASWVSEVKRNSNILQHRSNSVRLMLNKWMGKEWTNAEKRNGKREREKIKTVGWGCATLNQLNNSWTESFSPLCLPLPHLFAPLPTNSCQPIS